jgi:hypothetical protein
MATVTGPISLLTPMIGTADSHSHPLAQWPPTGVCQQSRCTVTISDGVCGLRQHGARGRPILSAITPAHTCLMCPALRALPPSLGHLVTPAHGLPSPPEWLNRGPASLRLRHPPRLPSLILTIAMVKYNHSHHGSRKIGQMVGRGWTNGTLENVELQPDQSELNDTRR